MIRRPRHQSDFDQARDLANAFNRLDRSTQWILGGLLIAIAIIALIVFLVRKHEVQKTSQQPPPATPPGVVIPAPPADAADNWMLGNPSNATADPANRDNYLMVKPYYTLSYNDQKGTPNWVSWRVTQADLGEAPRKREFDADSTLPAGFKAVTHQDYTSSGFDRGHICPHSDRAANEAMSFATFVMTNIIPQSPNVNQKAWRELEDYGRQLVKNQHVRLYVISGPNGQGGVGWNLRTKSPQPAQTIGKYRQITVPAECWKIILVAPETGGSGDPMAITADARVISVLMPNDNTQVTDDNWAPYRTTPEAIEQKTGYHFFDKLKPEVAAALRVKKDDVAIPPPKPHKFHNED
jgi:endonuclease G